MADDRDAGVGRQPAGVEPQVSAREVVAGGVRAQRRVVDASQPAQFGPRRQVLVVGVLDHGLQIHLSQKWVPTNSTIRNELIEI